MISSSRKPRFDEAFGHVRQIVLVLEARNQPILADPENLVLRVERAIVLDEIQPETNMVHADQIGDVTNVVDQIDQASAACPPSWRWH